MVLAAGLLAIAGCARQEVAATLAEASMVEGMRYAREVEQQSPFDTIEIRWSEAGDLMEKRNRAFIAARQRHAQAIEDKPVVGEFTREVKELVTDSFGGLFNTDSLLASLKAPAAELPKQLASIGGLKDLSHQMEQSAWDEAVASVDAELAMRKERIRLHRLLRMGELIDRELKFARASPTPPADGDPKFIATFQGWKADLREQRGKWLAEVRDLFDAEYQDVRFVPDAPGLPTYQSVDQPDLSEWQRWCGLHRSKELVKLLGETHQQSKPAIPGTAKVTAKLVEIVGREPEPSTPIRDTRSVRQEVRSLIQSWREMKTAQAEAARIEGEGEGPRCDSLPGVAKRQKLFQLRREEIEHASVVWMLDEACWH